MIALGPEICKQFTEAIRKEWLETNGLGSYAMGTVSQANSRRYHSLLTVAKDSPRRRIVLLNRLEESVLSENSRLDISCQQYPGAVHPKGYQYLEEFKVDPFPVWTYTTDKFKLKKTFFMRQGANVSVIMYELLSGDSVTLELRPLITFRNHHELLREDSRFDDAVHYDGTATHVSLLNTELHLYSIGGIGVPCGFWYKNIEYLFDAERGFDFREDMYCPVRITYPVKPGDTVALIASLERIEEHIDPSFYMKWIEEETSARNKVLPALPVHGPLIDNLAAQGQKFVLDNRIIAGYPWFGEWGRDTLISLPGLCLATGESERARTILLNIAKDVKDGLIPALYPENSSYPIYNAVDASLWFFWAVQKYWDKTKDVAFLKDAVILMRDIIRAYREGIPSGIFMDDDGLINVKKEAALTWMDAYINGIPVTPRYGKAVEIQALWYNALRFYGSIARALEITDDGAIELATRVKNSFNAKFLNAQRNYLYDYIDGDYRDGKIRPNALLSISLPYEALDASYFNMVVETARKELLTSHGLRTLSVTDADYKGLYAGQHRMEDAAYHQGTVWAWLMGPFIDAYIKTFSGREPVKVRITPLLEPFVDHMKEACIGSISEVFDGNPPHLARGCPSQAWSVAEIMRILVEQGIAI